MTTTVDDLGGPESGCLTMHPPRTRISGSFRRVAALFVLAMATISIGPSVSFSQASDFVIDPTQSYLTMSGTLISPYSGPVTEQFPGSLTTRLSEDMFVDVTDLSAIAFARSTCELAIEFGRQENRWVLHADGQDEGLGPRSSRLRRAYLMSKAECIGHFFQAIL